MRSVPSTHTSGSQLVTSAADSPGISRASRFNFAGAALEFGRPEPVRSSISVLFLARLDRRVFEPFVPSGDDHPVGGGLENGRPHEIAELPAGSVESMRSRGWAAPSTTSARKTVTHCRTGFMAELVGRLSCYDRLMSFELRNGAKHVAVGLSPSQLARRMKTSQSYIARIEGGKVRPSTNAWSASRRRRTRVCGLGRTPDRRVSP